MVTALVWEKSTKYQSGVVDQDGLWKKVIGELFEDFILFFLPELSQFHNDLNLLQRRNI